jgi:simple sugar transport system permease protein
MTALAARLGALRDSSLLGLTALAVAVAIGFSIATPQFATAINVQSMGFQVAELGLLSLAVALSMMTAGIDLSIVSVANMAAIVACKLFVATGAATASPGTALALTVACTVAAVLTGALCGALNGLIITRLRVSPILATLGTMQLLNGVAIAWTKGEAVYGMPSQFLSLGSGKVAGVPAPVVVLAVAALAVGVLVARMGLGLRLRLVGANAVAARFSGIGNDRVLLRTYVICGALASLAGVIIAARSASANADYGQSYLLLAIVVAVLGGVSADGGSGSIAGVVLAAVTLQMVSSGCNLVGLSQFTYQIAQGVILIAVMALGVMSQRGFAWTRLGRRRAPAPPDPGRETHETDRPQTARA